MKTQTIRRNSFKKIASILSNAKGVIAYVAVMRIDDSYDTSYQVSTAEEALSWLKDNQRGARVTLTGNVLEISGPYYFCDSFTVYLDEADFLAAKVELVDRYAEEVETVVEEAETVTEESQVLVAANDDVYEVPAEHKASPAITPLSDGGFYLAARGSKMTLRFSEAWDCWEMSTDNASHRAYRGLGVKHFQTLEEVERNYKSWRGIADLVNGTAYANQ